MTFRTELKTLTCGELAAVYASFDPDIPACIELGGQLYAIKGHSVIKDDREMQRFANIVIRTESEDGQ